MTYATENCFLFFLFFLKAEWRQFTQILVDAEIEEEDDLWGGSFTFPTLCTQMLKEDYVVFLLYISTGRCF